MAVSMTIGILCPAPEEFDTLFHRFEFDLLGSLN
jgi:hypothetical protein